MKRPTLKNQKKKRESKIKYLQTKCSSKAGTQNMWIKTPNNSLEKGRNTIEIGTKT